MSKTPIDKKLDLVLAALRGVGYEAVEARLVRSDIAALRAAAPGVVTGLYRGLQLAPAIEPRSHVVVRLPDRSTSYAPIGPRAFARWFELPTPWPPAQETAVRSRRTA